MVIPKKTLLLTLFALSCEPTFASCGDLLSFANLTTDRSALVNILVEGDTPSSSNLARRGIQLLGGLKNIPGDFKSQLWEQVVAIIHENNRGWKTYNRRGSDGSFVYVGTPVGGPMLVITPEGRVFRGYYNMSAGARDVPPIWTANYAGMTEIK